MSPLRKVLVFAQTRDLWQQDLIRRICTQAELTQQDIEEALSMLKAHHSLIPQDQALTPEALTAEHLPLSRVETPTVILNSIEAIENVNRLAKGQKLHFATDGITLVYGDTGTGKSGYCRVLKKLCHVRAGGEEEILGNAFEATSPEPAATIVRFTAGTGEVEEIHWRNGDVTPESLSRISAFDTKTIPIYADRENKIEFLPDGLDVLPRLGEACQTLVKLLGADIERLQRQMSIPLPDFPPFTTIATTVAKLQPQTPIKDLPSPEKIQDLAKWDEAFEEEVKTLEWTLSRDEQAMARRCRLLEAAAEGLSKEIQTVEKALGDMAVKNLIAKAKAANTAREASNLAAEKAFSNEPLRGVGSEPWRLMYQYARQYSNIAYPGEPFPVTGPDKLCLLCQQPLGDKASDRLQRFEKFVQETAQAEAERLEKVYEDAKAEVKNLKLRPKRDIETMLGDLEEADKDNKNLMQETATYFGALSMRHAALLEAFVDSRTFDGVPALPTSPSAKLVSAAKGLKLQTQAHDRARDAEKRKIVETKLSELQARKKLSENLATVLNRRRDLLQLYQLKACKDACDTSTISRKNTELRKLFITKGFDQRLKRELLCLGLDYLPLKVKDRSEYVASYLGVGLDAKIPVRNKAILSDGEFNALALACFLAEVGGIPGHNGIILDDPVSSLDHLRIKRVANRLIEESKKGRQVIVFTHNLVFYYELWIAAAEANLPMARHWIRFTKEHGFGTIYEKEEPWQAKKVSERLAHLDQKLKSIEKLSDRTGDDYRKAVNSFYTDYRETWERLVEELLLNSVVGRFQAGVMTQSLKGVRVENEDYHRIFFAVKRASEYSGHDRPRGRQISPPDLKKMALDIDDLRQYAKELRRRKEETEEARRAIEKPPSGKLI